MGKSISEVLTALTLCGANYRADSCKACPLNDSCKPGDNAALVDAATEAITDLVAFNALCLQEKAGLLQVLKHARVTVYVVVHRRRSTRDVFTLKTGLFRPNDLKRLGKTVFLNRGDAEKELRRLTEHQDADPDTGQKAVRFHHHVILKCQLTRDEIEGCWVRKKKRMGTTNADRLQMDKSSLYHPELELRTISTMQRENIKTGQKCTALPAGKMSL